LVLPCIERHIVLVCWPLSLLLLSVLLLAVLVAVLLLLLGGPAELKASVLRRPWYTRSSSRLATQVCRNQWLTDWHEVMPPT
jgi:hypothetical protein